MEFIDNVTPSSGHSYWQEFENFSPRKLWNKRDEQTARDYMSMHYQNAYNTALLNYQNEYNSPLQQMLRYQEAGLNPFLAQNDSGNMGSAIPGANPRGSSAVTPSGTEIAGSVNQGINALANVLRTAQGVYDYVQYGRPLQELNLQSNERRSDILLQQLDNYGIQGAILSEDLRKHAAEADWSQYWNYGPGFFPEDSNRIQDSPRARYMEFSTERISAQIEQLKSLVDVLYPSQKQANEARAALSDYQRQVMEGQNDAILSIDTGDPQRDAILKQVLFWLGNKLHY